MKKITLLIVAFISVMNVLADDVSYKPLQYEKLPDMKIERCGHCIIATSTGDIVVVGGHVNGFNLSATAERLHDGQWEMVPISNSHDGAGTIPLPDGRVLVCGGMGEGLGIGQSNACDIYDPATNSFTSVAGMKYERGFCNGVATGDGNNVLISGNWYASDATFELWDGSQWTSFGYKDRQLNNPYLFNAGDGIVYVFGCRSNYGDLDKAVVWRVDTRNLTFAQVENHGLEDYEIVHGDYCHLANSSHKLFLGKKDDTNYLMEFDTSVGQATQIVDLPRYYQGETNKNIAWSSVVLYSETRQEAYIIGMYKANGGKILIVANYSFLNESLTLFSEAFDGYLSNGAWILQPTTGNIIFTGGSKDGDNFTLIPTVISVTPYDKNEDGIIAPRKSSDSFTTQYYTIDGRQMLTPNRRGIYIKDGRKVVIK